MNILLWVLQVMLAFLCISGGVFQIFKIEDLKKGVAAMRELPKALWAFFGALSCLSGVALVLPGAIGMLPEITPIAASVVAVESAVISAIYIYYRDRAPLNYSIAMTVLAAFTAYGRFVLSPL